MTSHQRSSYESDFSKKLDPQSGRFYYIQNSTGEASWDVPHGIHIPLEVHGDNTNEELNKERNAKKREKIKKREQDLLLIRSRIEEHQRNIKREEDFQKCEQEKKWDQLWTNALKAGKQDGTVNLVSKKLGHISEKVYNYRKNFGIDLVQLSLIDNELHTIGEIPTRCPNLTHLSLSCNKIEVIEDEIAKLTHLTHLNLIKNRLTKLPSSIGSLTSLSVMDLANNKITEIPPSIQNLTHLKRINMECNQLQFLPNTMDKLKCETLILNSNKLQVLPQCLSYMHTLKSLSLNNNNLKDIPANIGFCSSIETLHASRNKIRELPRSISRLSNLKSLWLDYNNLTALPRTFHELRSLKELKMEGNMNMVYPTMDKISLGSLEVLRWSKRRSAQGYHARALNIILSIQDILKQVAKYEIGGQEEPHYSIFDADVTYQGERWYQFPIEAFWNIFLPSLEVIWANESIEKKGDIISFPYERDEVERTMATFQDASGPVVKVNVKAKFKCKSYLDNFDEAYVCVLTKDGWSCERPALLFKPFLTLERQMTERRRKEIEEENIEIAAYGARKVAKQFLATEEGMIMIRDLAQQRIANLYNTNSSQDIINVLNEETVHNEGSSLKLESKKRFSNHIYSTAKAFKSSFRSLTFNTNTNLLGVEEDLRQQYIEQEANNRRAEVKEMNRKMRKVMDRWLGLSMEEVFLEWTLVWKAVKARISKDQRIKNKSMRIENEENIAYFELAKKELLNWDRHYDNFNDIPYWVNIITGKISHVKPEVEHFLPIGWSKRDLPGCLINSNTGKTLSPRTLRLNEKSDDESDINHIPSDEIASYLDTANSDMNSGKGNTEKKLKEDGYNGDLKSRKDKEAAAAELRLLKKRKELFMN